jgi:hypothetical protein
MMSTLKNTQGESRSPVPWTPEEHAEYKTAYAAELAADPSADAGQLLRRAGERTPHLWGIRVTPDGTTVINPDRLSPETRTHFERMGLIPQPPHEAEATQLHAEATAAYAPAAQGAAVSGSDAARLSAVSFPSPVQPSPTRRGGHEATRQAPQPGPRTTRGRGR